MKWILFNMLFLFTAAVFSCRGAEKFSFEKPLKKGDSFQCRILTDQSVRYSFHLRGREQPVVRLETLQAAFNGYIRVLALNPQGNASELQIFLSSAHGTLNGRSLKIPSGKGKFIRIHGDLSGRNSLFRREDGRPLQKEESAVLQALFPPASASRISDLTGKERVLPAPGRSWKVDLTAFLGSLAQRNIRLDPRQIQGTVTYLGQTRIDSQTCSRFQIRMETDSLKEYDFRLKVTLDMGQDSPVPVKMKREAQEILTRVLGGDDPFSGGSRVTLHSQDLTEQWLIPVRKIPGESGVSSGNAAPPVQGGWKELLR